MSEAKKPVIVEAATVPVCSSCNRLVPPNEKAVQITCPNCGVALIIRCYKCRNMSIEYKCPNCGFEGP